MRTLDSATQEMADCCMEIEFDTFVVKAKLIVTLVANPSCLCSHAHLRFELHFFVCIGKMKGHWSHVNHVKREAILEDLHTTSAL